MDSKLDYDLIVEAVASYLVWSKDFFWNHENNFSIWLIPDGHHIYTGTLKAAWYRLLKPAKTLVLIWEWAVDKKMCVLWKSTDLFMWKVRDVDENVISILKWHDFVKIVDHEFDWVWSELPFLRIISDYTNIVFLEIWNNLPKIKLNNLLLKLSENANLMFVSDFHRDEPMELCKKKDSDILKLDFVKNNVDFFVVEMFLRMAKKLWKKPNLLAYLNTGDISVDKDITNWFWCVFL